jgi:hypothetical protein
MANRPAPLSFMHDPIVGVRARAMAQRARNVCFRRMEAASRPEEDCWCKVLRDRPEDPELPCPPPYEEPT